MRRSSKKTPSSAKYVTKVRPPSVPECPPRGLEQHFLANDIQQDKQVPSLLSLIGGKNYSLLRNLIAPDKPSTKTYAELRDILRNHICPKPLVIAERFRFHKRNQKEGENISAYVAELKNFVL